MLWKNRQSENIGPHYNFQSITVSKFHFEITHDSETGAAYILDRSSNGTYIDDHRVAKLVNNNLCKNGSNRLTLINCTKRASLSYSSKNHFFSPSCFVENLMDAGERCCRTTPTSPWPVQRIGTSSTSAPARITRGSTQ